jgi:hypothetical protein
MVRAIFDDLKSQTRRTRGLQQINQNPDEWEFCARNGYGNFVFSSRLDSSKYIEIKCPYGEAGNLLWVRETWADSGPSDNRHIVYRADYLSNQPDLVPFGGNWRPSIFMPRWASRLTLEHVSLRVERVASISEEDAKAEGIKPLNEFDTYRGAFQSGWDSINAKRSYSWEKNPWVWVVEFRNYREERRHAYQTGFQVLDQLNKEK